MSLFIRHIEFSNFRSYEKLQLDVSDSPCILVGKNAVGKTNIVEGIHLLTALTSFRNAPSAQLIRCGSDAARISLQAVDGERLMDIALTLEPGKRTYQLNGKAKKVGSIRGKLPCVAFTPDDLGMIKGSNSFRRDALDSLGSQLNENYHVICTDYENVMRNKNRLLKEEADTVLIESLNEMVNIVGSQLTCYRVALYKRFLPYLKENYARISSDREELNLEYIPSWDKIPFQDFELSREMARTRLSQALDSSLEQERQRGRCLVGPHADVLNVTLDGNDARYFASQGQQRSIVLAWKISEVDLIEEMLQNKPVLLLDDVMSELDEDRRNMLVSFFDKGLQSFITTTNLAYFDDSTISSAQIVNLPVRA